MRIPRWFWIPAALHGALGIGLCFVPLFNLLAYEFAFAVCILAAPTGLAIGMGAGKSIGPARQAILATWGIAVLHLVPPLIFISLNALRIQNCNYWEGLSFFALLPLCTSLYAGTLGVVIARTLSATRRRVRVLAALLVTLGPLAITLCTLYQEPPIFAFDHLWGHFAGSLYDEVIRLDVRLWLFRLGTLLRVLLLAAFVVAWDRRRSVGRWQIVGIIVLGVLAASLYETSLGGRVGFRVNRGDIEELLSDSITTEKIIIHLPAGVEPKLRQQIVDEHVFRVDQLTQRLGVELEQPLHSYVYPNADTKAQLMGGHNTQIAKPWLHEIHIHGLQSPHPVLAHELAHAVAATFGSPPFAVSSNHGIFVNMGLVEGLAEAVTVERGDLEIDRWAKALRQLELAPDMRTILGTAGFWGQAPRRAYTIAGSFVRFLLLKHGAEALRRVYSHGDFDAAYGTSLDALVTEWETTIDAIVLSEPELALARAQFDRPSIFNRACAHEVALLRQQASNAAVADAIPIYQRICAHEGNTPNCRMDLLFALERAGDNDGFLQAADQLLNEKRLHRVQRAQLIEARGGLLWKKGDIDGARADFQDVVDSRIDPDSQRLQWVRLWALTQPEPLCEDLRQFLTTELPPLAAVLALQDAARQAPTDPTLPYLIARQLIRVGEYRRAKGYLSAPHPFAPIEAERRRLLAEIAWNLEDFAAAEFAYATYAELAPTSGERARAMDWVERVRWKRRHSRPISTNGDSAQSQ